MTDRGLTISPPTARLVGLLTLVQLVTGLILPYVLLVPISTAGGGFIDVAAGMAGIVRLSVLMLVVGGAASLAIAVLLWPGAREHHPWLGLVLLALAVMNCTLQLIENAHWLTLLSISQAHVAGGAAPVAMEAIGIAAHAAFRWAHYSHIFIVVAWLFALYLLFYRSAAVPWPLALLGMLTAVSQFLGITLPAFAAYRMPFPELFGAPLAVVCLIAGLWLIVRGAGPKTNSDPTPAA